MDATLHLDCTAYGTVSLGSLIEALSKIENKEADVQFDFCYLRPTKVGSYRGYYDHLALGWSDESVTDKDGKFLRHWPSVQSLIDELKAAIGRTFEGWKGGDYRMTEETPVWVANRGESGGTGIIEIGVEGDHTVLLVTRKVD
jgi:hypothetical protein